MRNCIEKFRVKNYEVDHNGFFKPFSFLNHAQEMANVHAQSLGFGYDNLIASGVVWVLSRIHVKFDRLPLWKEELSIETWHKGNDRLFGFRDYSVKDKRDIEIISATSSWLIIDYKTRKLQRIETLIGNEFKGALAKHAIEEPASKIAKPSQLKLCNSKVVSISDIDINQHTNNARYLEWAIDSIDPEISTKAKIKELWMNFNNESLLGEKIELYYNQQKTQDSSLEIYVEGKRENISIFQVKIIS
ncbi:MAG: acyl-ACP thioesterase domain-containing protein [Bacteroidales bacterium]|nr:thioesterase [Bacteroidales bacterium]MDD4656785.1 thioesterase [Bacteroidales bacterium]